MLEIFEIGLAAISSSQMDIFKKYSNFIIELDSLFMKNSMMNGKKIITLFIQGNSIFLLYYKMKVRIGLNYFYSKLHLKRNRVGLEML